MPPNKRRALASRVKRKRRFFGIRKQDIASRLESDTRPSDDVEPSSSFTPMSSVQSRTAQKLLNSSFEELNDSMRVLTRRSSKKMGLSKQKQIEQADGFTIIDLSLLQEALQSSTNCRACKRSDSQLKILKDSRKKHGLAETLIIKCSCCSAETIFHTSKKLDKGKFEVNTRSVMACNSLKGGRKILSNFCGMMNLPSPLTSASYARQLKSSAKISREVAEKQMKDAANRLKKIRIESAVSEAVCCFNTGAGSRALMLKEAGIEDIGEESLKSLQKEDHIRQISAAQKVTSKYKSWRISRKRTKTNMKRSEKEHYEPGAFDSRGEKPISTKRRKRNQYSDCNKQNKVDQSVSDDVITDIPITFAVPLENIVNI
eukprot:gene17295-8873_t